MIDLLFEPIRINRMAVKNRIVMPAMHLNMAKDFQVTPRLVEFYEERAKGGAGIIVVGFATVDDLSGSSLNIGAHKDEFIPGLSELAAAIGRHGAKSAVQLNHAGRYNFSFFLDGKQPVAPSPIASRLTKETPRELPVEKIREVVASFGRAADRAKRAGFDAVEVLCGTGYLISEFLSPLTNQRTDDYGGSFENRTRFALEVIASVRAAVGPEYPVVARMNGNDFMPQGQGRRDLGRFAEILVGAAVDALCINVGWHEARVPQIVSEVPRGGFGYLARSVKERVDVPVIASHRINDPAVARQMMEDGLCDMVAMGRSLIADPYLPAKAAAGRETEIVHCIGCAQGCFDHLFELKPVACLCNPRAGRERQAVVEKAPRPMKVLVAGGGPAGMSAAAAAADRGHEVVLYEAGGLLGGQLHLAAAPPGRGEFAQLSEDLARQLEIRKVRVVLHRPVNEAVLETERPDAVILATGARPVTPAVPGADLPHVLQAWDVLGGRSRTGQKVVVVGGGAVGVETALFLAAKGTLTAEALKFLFVNRAETAEDLYELSVRGTKDVVLVEMIDRVGADIGKSTRWAMLQHLKQSGVSVRTDARVEQISKSGVRIVTGDNAEEIAADSVVLALGASPYNPLQPLVEKRCIPFQLVGDARSLAKAFDAVHQGFEAGRSL